MQSKWRSIFCFVLLFYCIIHINLRFIVYKRSNKPIKVKKSSKKAKVLLRRKMKKLDKSEIDLKVGIANYINYSFI
jgi:hypothetical protein